MVDLNSLDFDVAAGEVGGEAGITLLTCEQQDLRTLFAHFFDQLENTEIACVIKTGKALVKDHRRHFSVEEKLDERKAQTEVGDVASAGAHVFDAADELICLVRKLERMSDTDSRIASVRKL